MTVAKEFNIYIFIHQNGSTQKENTSIQTKISIKNTLTTHYVHSQSITILTKCIDPIFVFTNKFLTSLTFKLGGRQRKYLWRYYSTSNNSQMVQDRAIVTMTDRKSYMVYQTAQFSMILKNPKPTFEGQAILLRWISPKWLQIRP